MMCDVGKFIFEHIYVHLHTVIELLMVLMRAHTFRVFLNVPMSGIWKPSLDP